MTSLKQRQICFVGPFPAPVHGQSVSTAYVFDALNRAGLSMAKYDTGGGEGGKLASLVSKLINFAAAATWLITHRPTSAYISVHARGGMQLTGMLASIAKLRGHRVFLHHHTRSHLTPDNPRLAALAKSAGPDAVHITVCPKMSSMAQQACDVIQNVANFSNVGVVDIPSDVAQQKVAQQSTAFAPKVLGHMSNLTLDKGLGRVIESFGAALSAGLSDKLILAGPASTEEARAAIAAAKETYGDAVEWRGPVYGHDKNLFFKDIDVFLFPSLYADETQGIVNLEALATGTPVLAHDVCCVGGDLQGPAAASVPPNQDFVAALVPFLSSLPANAAQEARLRYETLNAGNKQEIEDLIAMLSE